MAGTLLNKVTNNLKRKEGGKLAIEATPLQQLSQQAGLPASPITPGGAAMIGANPDQAKMAGVSNQKNVSLAQATRQQPDQQQTLQQAQQAQTARTEKTTDEAAMASRVDLIQKTLQDTQAKAAYLVTNALPADETAISVSMTMPDKYKTPAPGVTPEELEAQWQLVIADPDNEEVMAKFLQLAGKTTAELENLKKVFSESATQQNDATVATDAAKNTKEFNESGVLALLPELMPNSENPREELAALLGVDPSVIDTMSVAELNNAVLGMEEQMSRSTSDIRSEAATAGQAERQELSGQLRDLAGAGVTAYEQQLNSLAQSLDTADTVEFGGQTYTLEKLLADDTISQIIKDYITDPESDTSKKLAADPSAKGLIDFITNHKEVLTKAAEDLGKTATVLQDVYASNEQLANYKDANGSTRLDGNIMKILYPDWDPNKITATKNKAVGVVAGLQGMPADKQRATVDAINKWAAQESRYPGITAELAKIGVYPEKEPKAGTPAHKQWEKDKAAWEKKNNPATILTNLMKPGVMDQYFATKDLQRNLEKNKNNPDALIDAYLEFDDPNLGTGQLGLKNAIENASIAEALGIEKMDPILASLDVDPRDGIPDKGAADYMYKQLLAGAGKADSLSEVAAGATSPSQKRPIVPTPTPAQQNVYAAIGPDILNGKDMITAIHDYLGNTAAPPSGMNKEEFLANLPASFVSMLGPSGVDTALIDDMVSVLGDTKYGYAPEIKQSLSYSSLLNKLQQSMASSADGTPDQVLANTIVNMVFGYNVGKHWQDLQKTASDHLGEAERERIRKLQQDTFNSWKQSRAVK